MKLLIYSHFFAPTIGGVETVVDSLARGLAEFPDSRGGREFEITLVTQTPAASCDDSALPFRMIRRPGFFQLWDLIGQADRVFLAGPAILPLLFSRLRRKNDIVMHQGYQAICPNGMLFQFAPQTDCPGHFAAGRYGECLRCNAPQEGWAGSLQLLLLTFVRRALVRRVSANVGASQHVTNRIALPQSHMIRNAAPAGGDPTAPLSTEDSHPEVRFAYVGRLVTEKGVKVLLRAASLLAHQGFAPPILIIGDGPERPALEQQKKLLELGENVLFLGFQRGAELQKKIKSASVLVIPSLWQDVAPLSILEMMTQGRMIMGSKIGGISEQIGEAGMTFAPGDAQGLAQCMRAVIENPALLESFGKKARERAASLYSLERMIGEYKALFVSRQ